MKVLVCGSRSWCNEGAIRAALQGLPPGTIVVHGDAHGADKIAGRIAKGMGFEVRPYPADWDVEGKAAGPKRNSRMLKEEHPDPKGLLIDKCFAFSLDLEASRGTKDMVRKTRAAGITVVIFEGLRLQV